MPLSWVFGALSKYYLNMNVLQLQLFKQKWLPRSKAILKHFKTSPLPINRVNKYAGFKTIPSEPEYILPIMWTGAG